MSLLYSFFLIFHFLNIGAGNDLSPQQLPAGTPETRGAWLARQVDERDTGRDSRASLRMKLFDRQGRARERALTLLTMRGGTGRPTPGDRTLVRFTSPADINGTGLLVWEQPAGEDERFLYLPSLGRVRRIAGAESQESFVGSDFTYEDIGGRELEKYTYTLVDEDASWTAPGGGSHPAWRMESKSKDASARWPRVVSLIRKDNFIVVHAEIFNRRNEVQKTFEARRLERVDGYWTVLEMHMADQSQRTRTELVVESIDYDTGLTSDSFSRRELERVGPAASRGRAPSPSRP
jgi:hypothetical protein